MLKMSLSTNANGNSSLHVRENTNAIYCDLFSIENVIFKKYELSRVMRDVGGQIAMH